MTGIIQYIVELDKTKYNLSIDQIQLKKWLIPMYSWLPEKKRRKPVYLQHENYKRKENK